MSAKMIWCLAAISIAVATALGAFGTHALRPILTPERFASFDVAVTYQFFHSLGLLGIGFLQRQDPTNRVFGRLATALLVGIMLFCGSIYALTFGAPKWIAMIAPFGGGTLILSWVLIAIAIWRSPSFADSATR
ncbi:MAG: hypothetical protein RL321_1091 [Pseudomonadota bacterium]|jgi:uncharacterized membrane protein YgdD (TMEM256/DUF423 family)